MLDKNNILGVHFDHQAYGLLRVKSPGADFLLNHTALGVEQHFQHQKYFHQQTVFLVMLSA